MTFVQGLIVGSIVSGCFGFILGAVAVALKLALNADGDGRKPRSDGPLSTS